MIMRSFTYDILQPTKRNWKIKGDNCQMGMFSIEIRLLIEKKL